MHGLYNIYAEQIVDAPQQGLAAAFTFPELCQ